MFFRCIKNNKLNFNPQLPKTIYDQQLITALNECDVAKLKLALENGADPNTCNEKLEPAIILAAKSKRNTLALMHALLMDSDITVDLNTQTIEYGTTPLMMLVCVGREVNDEKFQAFQLLLSEGAKIKIRNKNNRTLGDHIQCLGFNNFWREMNKFKKSPINVKSLDKQAFYLGRKFSKKYHKQLPLDIISLIGNFLYGKSRLKNQFVPGMLSIYKEKTLADKLKLALKF